jgi:hypothetical protein
MVMSLAWHLNNSYKFRHMPGTENYVIFVTAEHFILRVQTFVKSCVKENAMARCESDDNGFLTQCKDSVVD